MKLMSQDFKGTGKIILKKLSLISAGFALALSAAGCNGGGGGYYAPAWYNVYGGYCGSTLGPGCNFYGDGYKITASEDPYWSTNYFTFGFWTYYDSYGYYQSYTGYGWQSPDGIIYTDSGYALNNSEDRDSKDWIADVSDAESKVVSVVGEKFATKYALSADTGLHIARTLNDYATLTKKSKKRARTEQDIADFSKRLYGVTAEKATAAIDDAKKGNPGTLENLNGEVATYWGTSPETSKAILKSWYKHQLSEVGM